MYRNDRLIDEVTERVTGAEKSVLENYRSTAIEHEPQITDRLLSKIEGIFENNTFAGVAWGAKTLTSQGPNTQESVYGADFMGVLTLKLPGYKVSKGFMAQAKRLEPGQQLKVSDFKDLLEQCNQMLNASPMSYVFIYSAHSGIRVASAIDVLSARTRNPLNLTTLSLGDFFKMHFQCHIGDRRFHAATAKQLRNLLEEYGPRKISQIHGTSLELLRSPG